MEIEQTEESYVSQLDFIIKVKENATIRIQNQIYIKKGIS